MNERYDKTPDEAGKAPTQSPRVNRDSLWIMAAVIGGMIVFAFSMSVLVSGVRETPGVGRIFNRLWPPPPLCERIDEATARRIGLAKMDYTAMRFAGPSARQDFYDSLELCPHCVKVWDGLKSKVGPKDTWSIDVMYRRFGSVLFESDGTFRSHRIRRQEAFVVLDRCGNKIREGYGGG